MMEGVVEQLATLGIHLDSSSSKSLAVSLDK